MFIIFKNIDPIKFNRVIKLKIYHNLQIMKQPNMYLFTIAHFLIDLLFYPVSADLQDVAMVTTMPHSHWLFKLKFLSLERP